MREGRARILVSLNRRHGPIHVGLRATAPVGLAWNGRPVVDGKSLDPIERGVHELQVSAPPGTVLEELSLRVPPGTPP
jgi:hypothetical protein